MFLGVSTAQLCAQYFNNLYDFDSTQSDWGLAVFQENSGSYSIFGVTYRQTVQKRLPFIMNVQQDGNMLFKKSIISSDTFSYEIGNGPVKKLGGNQGYISPLMQILPQSPVSNVNAGICRVNHLGDTIFTKFYTDTALYKEYFWDCDTAANGGYILGGYNVYKGYPFTSNYNLIIRTDSTGTLKWHKKFNYNSNYWSSIASLEWLPNNTIFAASIIGQIKTVSYNIPTKTYSHNRPWLMILDSNGNILKQRIFPPSFAGLGTAFKDKHGGYMIWGQLDTFFAPTPSDFRNLPTFMAHLDEDFQIDWMHSFLDTQSHKHLWGIKQLRDSNYLVYGIDQNMLYSTDRGWVSKFNLQGNMLWERTFFIDSTMPKYITNAFQETNGDLLFVGHHRDKNLPQWRGFDVWFFRTDSTGCPSIGCPFPTSIPPDPSPETKLSLYPNPTNGELNIRCDQGGMFVVYNLQGISVFQKEIKQGITKLELPNNFPSGMYIGRMLGNKSNNSSIRFVYEP